MNTTLRNSPVVDDELKDRIRRTIRNYNNQDFYFHTGMNSWKVNQLAVGYFNPDEEQWFRIARRMNLV